jgi:hypothetical protein
MNKINPELRRNLWLEFSPHRLIAVPVVIALIAMLMVASGSKDVLASIASAAGAGFGVIVLLWGTKLAGASVIEEARDRTWDAQRMSSITPWTMTWGKLLGAPSFAWYGGIILLLIFVFTGGGLKVSVWRYAALMGCSAVLLHATALNASVLAARKGVSPRSAGTLLLLCLAVVVLIPGLNMLGNMEKSVTWWSMSIAQIDFLLASAAAFGAWAVLGAYRSMCNELEIRTTPWALPAFIVFAAAYVAGFALNGRTGDPGALFGITAAGVAVAMAFSYSLLFAEKSGASAWQQLRARVQAQQWRRALQELPLWLVALGVGLVMAVIATLSSISVSGSSGDDLLHKVGLAPIAVILFAVRDAAIFQFFALARQPRRVEAATLFYLILLYGLLPGLLKAFGADAIAKWILPPLTDRPAITTVIMALQAAIAIALAWWRWRLVHAPDMDMPQRG